METFIFLWQLLERHGVIPGKQQECARLWEKYTLEQQRYIYDLIYRKINAGKFVHYDPVRAILENAPKQCKTEPTFLRGDEGGDLVQVKYNGLFKICTRETAEQFGLEVVRKW